MTTLSYSYLLSHSLAWALLHSLWQGAIVFGLLFAVLKALGGLSAKVKYVLSITSLAIMAIWFVSTWVGHFKQLFNEAEIASQQLISSLAHIAVGGGNVVRMAAIGSESVFSLRSWLEHNAGVIMLLYSIGFVFMSLRVIVNFAGVQRIRTKFISLPGDDLLELLHNGIVRLGISLPVQLRLSSKVTVPMMVGALKPMILVPLATVNQLTTAEMEAILLHELAHIKRHDYLLNFFQVVIETILFFNPFVWLLSAIIRREREHACDDVVVEHIQNPLPYAKALAAIESCRL